MSSARTAKSSIAAVALGQLSNRPARNPGGAEARRSGRRQRFATHPARNAREDGAGRYGDAHGQGPWRTTATGQHARDFPLLHRSADLRHRAVAGHPAGRRRDVLLAAAGAISDITPPTVQVLVLLSGANAQVVADTVAAPIEQQVNGVENMLYMSSQCTNDGAYTLTVTFQLGTDLKLALVQVQNRVQLAMPQMPQQVQLQGINIKKKTPNILLVVNLFSPDGRYNDLYLSNYATICVRDELMRLAGVSDVSMLGERDYSIRAWLIPKLASRYMTAGDVVNAVQEQNNQVVSGQLNQPPAAAGANFSPPLPRLAD